MAAAAAAEGPPWRVHAALAFAQLAYGGYHVVGKLALSGGVAVLPFCAWRDAIASAALAPAAAALERGKPAVPRPLLPLLALLGCTGVLGNQLLFMLGLDLTSPAYAAALQPAIPVFTFALALLTRMETVHLERRDGQAKLLGVAICVLGALTMAVYRGPQIAGGPASAKSDGFVASHSWFGPPIAPADPPGAALLAPLLPLSRRQLGVLCLVGNCLCMAMYLTIQVSVLAKYDAPVTVTAYSYSFGALLVALVGIVATRDLSKWVLTVPELLAASYAGLVASALTYGLLSWANKLVGPALVALYMPIQPLSSALLALVFLGSPLYLGSVLGGIQILAGLYLVTWGRAEAERSSGQVYHRVLDA
eukprot:SM000077S21621  [mRNA]  locus=s77:523129:525932:- [translate_table: standard]